MIFQHFPFEDEMNSCKYWNNHGNTEKKKEQSPKQKRRKKRSLIEKERPSNEYTFFLKCKPIVFFMNFFYVKCFVQFYYIWRHYIFYMKP